VIMKVTEISVKHALKYVNFSSAMSEIGLKATIDEDEDIDKARKELSDQVHDMLLDDLNIGIGVVNQIRQAQKQLAENREVAD